MLWKADSLDIYTEFAADKGRRQHKVVGGENGVQLPVSTEGGKMKSRLNYANRLGIPFVIFVGEDEIASGNITLKNMESGAQAQFEVGAAAEQIISYVNGKKAAKIINLK